MGRPQVTAPVSIEGSQLATRARGLDAVTTSPEPGTLVMIAQNLTDAPIVLGSSLIGVIAWFWICRVPTLPAGNRRAAYELPPSATNSARYATALERRCGMTRFNPYSLPDR
jgi:hypothetical protein